MRLFLCDAGLGGLARWLRGAGHEALSMPPSLTKTEQLAFVFREFDLSLGDTRCMSCGGELRRIPKEAVRERIPPKTWLW